MSISSWVKTSRQPASAATKTSAGIKTVLEAIDDSSTLGGLLGRMKDAREAFAAIENLLPLSLEGVVKPGPIQEGTWTLLVSNASALTKLKQLCPLLLTRVQASGQAIQKIQLKRVFA